MNKKILYDAGGIVAGLLLLRACRSDPDVVAAQGSDPVAVQPAHPVFVNNSSHDGFLSGLVAGTATARTKRWSITTRRRRAAITHHAAAIRARAYVADAADKEKPRWIQNFLIFGVRHSNGGSQTHHPFTPPGVSVLMTIRDGKSWLYTLTTAPVCGLIALGIAPLLQHFGLPDNAAPAIGPVIGFIGADKVREIILGIIDRRASK